MVTADAVVLFVTFTLKAEKNSASIGRVALEMASQLPTNHLEVGKTCYFDSRRLFFVVLVVCVFFVAAQSCLHALERVQPAANNCTSMIWSSCTVLLLHAHLPIR